MGGDMSDETNNASKQNWKIDFGAIAYGFAGGVLAIILTYGLIVDADTQLKDHALLSAPFLYFVSFLILIFLFHRPIGSLLSRGNVTFKWGDKEISMQELEENIDKEVDTVAGDVEFLKSEHETVIASIELLKTEVARLSSALQQDGKLEKAVVFNDGDQKKQPEGSAGKGKPFSSTPISQIKESFGLGSDEEGNIIYHLGNSKYKWRNEKTLLNRTALEANQVKNFTRRHPELVVQSRAKSGNTIYRLTDEAKAQFRETTSSG